MRSAPTVRASPRSLTPLPPARGRWKPPIARSRSGSMPPSTPSAPCSQRTAAGTPQRQAGKAISQVNVTINGRQFRMACEDGEEARLLRLAADLDASIAGLRTRFGEIGDTRLTVMAALTLAHEPTETEEEVRVPEQT